MERGPNRERGRGTPLAGTPSAYADDDEDHAVLLRQDALQLVEAAGPGGVVRIPDGYTGMRKTLEKILSKDFGGANPRHGPSAGSQWEGKNNQGKKWKAVASGGRPLASDWKNLTGQPVDSLGAIGA